MVKISELSMKNKQQLVNDISNTFFIYKIDKESVKEFWDRLEMGIEMKRRV